MQATTIVASEAESRDRKTFSRALNAAALPESSRVTGARRPVNLRTVGVSPAVQVAN